MSLDVSARTQRTGFGGAEAEARLDVRGEDALVVGPVGEQREHTRRAVQCDQDAPDVAAWRLRRQRADRRRPVVHLRIRVRASRRAMDRARGPSSR